MGRQLSPHLLTDKSVAELHQETFEIARRIRLDNQPRRHLFDELPPNPWGQLEVTRECGPKFLEDLLKRHKGELVELTSTWRAVHAPAPATGGAWHVKFNLHGKFQPEKKNRISLDVWSRLDNSRRKMASQFPQHDQLVAGRGFGHARLALGTRMLSHCPSTLVQVW
jgi:hypothetical protein